MKLHIFAALPKASVFPGLLLAALLTAGGAEAQTRLTEKCNPGWTISVAFHVKTDSPVLSAITGVVNQPTSDPQLYARLWEPTRMRTYNYVSAPFENETSVSLDYPPSQDMDEILASIRQDPLFQTTDVKYLMTDGPVVCFSAGPPPTIIPLTEFYNAGLDHYALAAGPAEVAYVEQGHWGTGWARTGETFDAKTPGACFGTHYVQRFASLRNQWPPSLFYTVKPEVCGYLRSHSAGWRYAASAFGAVVPENGACPAGFATAIYQLFNNRPDVNQANHRYTSKLEIYNSMQAQGWVGEGIAFCL